MKKCSKILTTILLSTLMLTGCVSQGPQGEKGPKGEAGQKGEQGVSVVSIVKTKTEGLVDTYTITYSNQTTSTFTITNGKQGDKGDDGSTPTVAISDDGYWVINGTKTSIVAEGINGKDGVSITSIVKTNSEGSVDTYTITFSNQTTQTFTVKNGTDGKSAYELYCEQYEYEGSLEDWLEKFYTEDTTDYSKYSDFEFTPVTYHGEKGYTASYIGTGGDVVIPETFNLEPVLGFKFGFNDIHEILEEDPEYKIDSIYVSSNVKFIALNGNSNYALHCLSDTLFTFTGSIDEIIYTNYVFEEICFDGSQEDLEKTNLIEKFPITNIYTKNADGDYEKTVTNGDKFNQKYGLICEQIENIRTTLLPDMTTFEDGVIDNIPTEISIEYEEKTLVFPLKLVINDETDACYVRTNVVKYAASKISNFKGKEVFLAEFFFELEGKEYVATSSTIVVSKMPNKFVAFDHSFGLKEYNEVYSESIGNKYSKTCVVHFDLGQNLVKAYYENGHGSFETAMPTLAPDTDSGSSSNVSYNEKNKCFDCTKAGDYNLSFDYINKENQYFMIAKSLDTKEDVALQMVCDYLQQNYPGFRNSVYLKSGDKVVIPNTVDFKFEGYSYTPTITAVPQLSDHITFNGNTLTFDIGSEEAVFEAIFFRIDFGGGDLHTNVISFHLTKQGE